jgi:hypothetical protein
MLHFSMPLVYSHIEKTNMIICPRRKSLVCIYSIFLFFVQVFLHLFVGFYILFILIWVVFTHQYSPICLASFGVRITMV